METRQMITFFSSMFWTVCDTHFCIWKLSKFIFIGSSFRPFWSAKYLDFGGVSCEIRILSHSVQETYTLRKVKNQVLLFLLRWELNLSNLMVYFCLFQNAILLRIEGKVLKFKPTLVRMQFSLVATFFLSLSLVICLSWNLHLKPSCEFLTYRLTFGDKSVTIFDLHICYLKTWKSNGLSKHLKGKVSSYMDNIKRLLRSRLNVGFNLNYFSFSL